MFSTFETRRIPTGDVTINTCWGGAGPPLLLLHGYPQTHVMWHRVAPRLAEAFTVVCPDLRGYGDSDAPRGDPDHHRYSKRVMAHDQVQVMRTLGFDTFAVAGHDRGGRVALRLALDYPETVSRLAVLDIVPTREIYETLDQPRATTVWRYLFLIQPPDLPERLVGADPGGYLHWTLDEWAGDPNALDGEAVAEYERCFDAETIHATCEDYRAGSTIDLVHDRLDADRPVSCPTLVLFSRGGLGRHYDVERIWRRHAPDLVVDGLNCGHFLAEERPEQTVAALSGFFSTPTGPDTHCGSPGAIAANRGPQGRPPGRRPGMTGG